VKGCLGRIGAEEYSPAHRGRIAHKTAENGDDRTETRAAIVVIADGGGGLQSAEHQPGCEAMRIGG